MYSDPQSGRRAVLELLLFICLAAAYAQQANAQSNAFTVAPILRTGDPISNGSFFNFCKFCDGFIDGNHGLNDNGQAVVSGAFESFNPDGVCQSVVIGSDHKGAFIADLCQTTEFGRFSAFVDANINNSGQVALSLGTANNNGKLIILLFSNGQLSKIAAEGDQSPAGTVFGGDCGFGPPSINDNGDIAFYGCSDPDAQGRIFNGVYAYSGGVLRTVLKSGDPSPLGGTIGLIFANGQPVSINNNGDVLFTGAQTDAEPIPLQRSGLFIAKHDGTVIKVELGGDLMPSGSTAAPNSVGFGTLNNNGQVAFSLLLTGKPKAGIFLYSDNHTQTVALHGQRTPLGGMFDFLGSVTDPRIVVNDAGAVGFKTRVANGPRDEAIFLASPKAMVEVAAVGDILPTGEPISAISSFSLNNQGQVAFFATKKQDGSAPVGLYIATPVTPTLTKAKVKGTGTALRLVLDGSAFITNDSIIQINGQPVETEYPSAFQQSGGTTTRLISRDPMLSAVLQPAKAVQITVVNSLTA
ncbi:MAG: DUF7453 family protein, partial [Blastocatellia bacterium]